MMSKLLMGEVTTKLVPGVVDYTVLLPPNINLNSEPIPLLVHMHGGGLDHSFIGGREIREMYEKLWAEEALPPMAVACYSARGSIHLNYRDGSECWEDFAFEFIRHMNRQYNTRVDAQGVYLFGVSMGALGALRLSLKYPERFDAVAAMGGVLYPAFELEDVEPRNFGLNLNRTPEEQLKLWGYPVDADFFRANNQVVIARDNAQSIRESDLTIYLEAGDCDFFNAHDGNEFLHRVLWENGIAHEYRLLHGCDHLGESLLWRISDAHRWLGRQIKPSMNAEAHKPAEPTKEQKNYLYRAYRGQATELPTETEAVGIFAEAAIAAHRYALPDKVRRYADRPLDGVFRLKNE